MLTTGGPRTAACAPEFAAAVAAVACVRCAFFSGPVVVFLVGWGCSGLSFRQKEVEGNRGAGVVSSSAMAADSQTAAKEILCRSHATASLFGPRKRASVHPRIVAANAGILID